jgi:hypothetical protein
MKEPYNPGFYKSKEGECPESAQSGLLNKLKNSETNLDKSTITKYNLDGCGCMSCGCFKSAWTIVLSPAGIAAGMAAFAADAAL